MVTEKQQAALALYASLMDEANVRLTAIDAATNGLMAVPPPLAHEICYLQLRMLCEIIALGCLVAHGDIKATQAGKLRKTFSADTILQEMEKLHPDFYPRPVQRTQLGPRDFRLDPVDFDFLKKPELPLLVGRCGDILHRGSIKKLYSQNKPAKADFTDAVKWAAKIYGLLRMHHLTMFGKRAQFMCVLRDSQNGGRAMAYFAMAIEE